VRCAKAGVKKENAMNQVHAKQETASRILCDVRDMSVDLLSDFGDSMCNLPARVVLRKPQPTCVLQDCGEMYANAAENERVKVSESFFAAD
jgi:hypothetical protein